MKFSIVFLSSEFTNLEIAIDEETMRKITLFYIAVVLMMGLGLTTPTWAAPLFDYQFKVPGTMWESASSSAAPSTYWWLPSGGQLIIENGQGKTIQGELPTDHVLRKRYARNLPQSSDNGFHPQNIFKLLTKGVWQDAAQSVRLKVTGVNILNPDNNHAWNGVAVVGRYLDDNHYYYGGVRVDGQAAIKKKSGGEHYTLIVNELWSDHYDPIEKPSVLPEGQEFGLKLEIVNLAGGQVKLTLLVDEKWSGDWRPVASVVDDGERFGGPAHVAAGASGLFSDYLDLEMDDYQVVAVGSTNTDPVGGNPAEPEPADPLAGELYGLSQNLTLEEAGSAGASASGEWWINSGGYFKVSGGMGSTVIGELPGADRWRLAYAAGNPLDTDDGYHPQNIFRLLTKDSWQNLTQQVYFRLKEYNVSPSPNRDGHNGFLFFNRYQDSNNLYYTGLRVDGKAVIKKKQDGQYTTLKMSPVFAGDYDRSGNPNLIPEGKWIGLRSLVRDNSDGSVKIEVYADLAGDGSWQKVAEATDVHNPIRVKAAAGFRTDFMDVEFKDYRVGEI